MRFRINFQLVFDETEPAALDDDVPALRAQRVAAAFKRRVAEINVFESFASRDFPRRQQRFVARRAHVVLR